MHFNGDSMFVSSYHGIYPLVFLLLYFWFPGIVLSVAFWLSMFHLFSFFLFMFWFCGLHTINLILDDMSDSCLHVWPPTPCNADRITHQNQDTAGFPRSQDGLSLYVQGLHTDLPKLYAGVKEDPCLFLLNCCLYRESLVDP